MLNFNRANLSNTPLNIAVNALIEQASQRAHAEWLVIATVLDAIDNGVNGKAFARQQAQQRLHGEQHLMIKWTAQHSDQHRRLDSDLFRKLLARGKLVVIRHSDGTSPSADTSCSGNPRGRDRATAAVRRRACALTMSTARSLASCASTASNSMTKCKRSQLSALTSVTSAGLVTLRKLW